jgi:hypothetical protein
MPIKRRELLAAACSGAAALMASPHVAAAGLSPRPPDRPDEFAYRYCIAFGAWINDMRRQPLPLEDWPALQFDHETVESAIAAMDVQAAAGFNYL